MNESPRLLLCTFDVVPGPGGATRRLAESLDALGEHFVPEVLSVKGPEQTHIERFHGARLLRVPVGNGTLPQRAEAFERAVRRQLESDDYAAVQFSDPFGGYALCEAREHRGYRLIYEALRFPSHELRERWPELENDRKFLSRVRRRELFCLMNADRVITGSHVTRSFVQSLGVSADSIEVLPTPIDVGATVAPAIAQHETLHCLYIGGSTRWQGLETLLRGIALAQAEVELSLEIVGVDTPSALEPLGALLGDLGIADRVIFRGRIPNQQLATTVGQADVVLLPLVDCERNRLQGGPLDRLAEVLATGRPIVAADLPLTRERLPGGCAVFHRPGDPAALSTALLQVARNPKKREEMGRRARAEAMRSLDVLRYRARLLRLYGELIGPSGPPGPGGPSDDVTGSRDPTTDPTGAFVDSDEAVTRAGGTTVPLAAYPDAAEDIRAQATPRSRLQEYAAQASQETRVARLDALRPPVIPSLASAGEPAPAPPVANSVLQGIADVLAEVPTAQLELPAELVRSPTFEPRDAKSPPRSPPAPPGLPRTGLSSASTPPRGAIDVREGPPHERSVDGDGRAKRGPPPLKAPTAQHAAVRPPLPAPQRTVTGPVPRIGGGKTGSHPAIPRTAAAPLIGGGGGGSTPAATAIAGTSPSTASSDTTPSNGSARTPGGPPPIAGGTAGGTATGSTPAVARSRDAQPASPPPLPRVRTGEVPSVVRPQPAPPPLTRNVPALAKPSSTEPPAARAPRPEATDPAVPALPEAPEAAELPAAPPENPPDPAILAALEAPDDGLLPGADPWLLQVLQGYCPPGNSKSFDRHAPPTTFPGRAAPKDASSASQKVG